MIGSNCLAEPALSVDESIQYALEHSPVLDASRRDIRVSELEHKSTFARLLPSLDFKATQGLQGHTPTLYNTPWVNQLSLGLTENLYDNGETLTNFRITDLQKESVNLVFLKIRDQLCLDVTLEFYKYSLARNTLEVSREVRALLQKQLDMIEGQYHQGMKTREDFNRFKTQLQRANIDVLTGENAIARSQTELERILGVSPINGAHLAFKTLPIETSGLEVPESAPSITGNHEYQLVELQKKLNGYSITLADRRYWPQIFITSSIGYQNGNYLAGLSTAGAANSITWNTLLGVSYNLWDWGIRKRDVQVTEERVNIQADHLTEQVLALRARIDNLMLDFKRSKAEFELSRQLREAEQRSFEFLRNNYRQGKVPYLDLITALKDLSTARTSYLSTYFGLLGNLALYRYFEGSIYETTKNH